MKTTLAAALAFAALTPAVPALAGEQSILVETAAMESWTESVQQTLDRRLIDSVWAARVEPVSGIVQLRFQLDEQGRATDLEVYRSTGHRRTDTVAARAVRHLRNLDEVPVSNPHQRTFQANIIFAQNPEEFAALEQELARSEASRLALGNDEASVVVLGG
ncbi:TonB family protein [Altererythrobacter arenosus]|uniref:TonB family protein n=1 Tax=Altererythrobacter arenosus TaxID=3032592 RepID=A0ABY8FWD5_9SPHN|nr:TonB family protein [Altererythrobacter sp. CAU 1644]WFL78380.1 TonB family protein [Altererythrobacter sp. CAU 1644]